MTRVLLAMRGAASSEDRVAHARLTEVLAHVVDSGVEVVVALAGDPGGLRHDLESVVSVRVLPVDLPPAPQSAVALPRAVGPLRALVREFRPDVIEGHEPIPGIAAGLAARTGGAVSIYRRHHQTGSLRLRATSRLAARLSDYTAISNESLRERVIEDDRVAGKRVLIVASGTPDLRPVPAWERARLRQRLGLAPSAPVVAAVSRLRREKGLDILLAALPHLRAASVATVIVGAGPERDALQEQARRLGAGVTFASHQSDVAPWLAIADIVAIPSRREAFGRTTVQAMAAGRPIVATRVGGLVEGVVDGVNGRLVEPEDPRALAAALDLLLADPALAQRMGAAGRERFETRHTIAHMAAAWRAAWTMAMTHPAGPSSAAGGAERAPVR